MKKTCVARQEFRRNCSQNLLELLNFICLFLHLLKKIKFNVSDKKKKKGYSVE